MSFSFSSLIRLIGFLAIGATMFAVGVARIEDPSPARRMRNRPSNINSNEYYVKPLGRDPQWLNIESGRVAPMPLVAGDVLEAASCSPWTDEKGRVQVVGRWSSRSPQGPKSTTSDFGLARYSFPGGELIDHVSTDIMPIGAPAWYPGTRARVLYAAGDGRLYQFAFEKDGKAGSKVDPRPRPLAWRCPVPGVGEAYASDVQWPDDPRMVDRVVATVRFQEVDEEGARTYTHNQLWWLKLDQAGTSIIEAGRLVDGDAEGHDERSPAIASLPDGRLVAAYLRREDNNQSWRARVAPIRIDPDRRTPGISWATSRELDADCVASPLAFSSDGRYLAAVVGQDVMLASPTRISTAPALFPDHRTLLAGPVSTAP